MNPFLRNPKAFERTPIHALQPGVKSDGSGVATLRLYDPIDSWGGPWGLSAREFVAALDEIPADTTEIRVLINSPGGEVWEGLAILNALRANPARVTAVVEGIAASAASFIATGVDELQMMANSQLFIHNAWGLCVGSSADMTKMAADLLHEDRNLASIYAAKAGGTVDDWLAAMADETYYTAEEAVAAKLADAVVGGSNDGAAQAMARFDLSIFADRRSAIVARQATHAAEAGETRKEGIMPTLKESLAERLGFDPAADDDTVLAAVDEALAPPEPDPDPGSPPQLPEGVVAIDEATLAALQDSARRGDEARAEQERAAQVALVDDKIRGGCLAPSQRAAWIDRLAKDPSEAAVLASLTQVYPVGGELGHANSPGNGNDDDAVYAALFGQEA